MQQARVYNEPIYHEQEREGDFELFTAEDWEKLQSEDFAYGYTFDNGSAYWVKNWWQSRDDAHRTPREDATHVTWYNK